MDSWWLTIFGPISNPPAFGVFYLVKYYGGLIYFISHTMKNRLKNAATLRWTHQTPSTVQYATLVSSMDTLCSSIFNSGELIGHPLQFNIQLPWAHQTPSTVQYSITLSPPDTLHSSIFNSHELIGHPLQFNIQLWWAQWTPSTV